MSYLKSIKFHYVIIAGSLLAGFLMGVVLRPLLFSTPGAATPVPTPNPTPNFMMSKESQQCGPFEYREPWIGYPIDAQGRCILVAEEGNALGIAWSGFPVMLDPYTKSQDLGGAFEAFTPDIDGEQWYCERYSTGAFCVEAPEGELLALRITVASDPHEEE